MVCTPFNPMPQTREVGAPIRIHLDQPHWEMGPSCPQVDSNVHQNGLWGFGGASCASSLTDARGRTPTRLCRSQADCHGHCPSSGPRADVAGGGGPQARPPLESSAFWEVKLRFSVLRSGFQGGPASEWVQEEGSATFFRIPPGLLWVCVP